ncbi:MAG TPA: sulfotransferase [Steroidobacteraceae bacterium]|nr:sulfotransferase [Steroidobacteraceae bacterium]
MTDRALGLRDGAEDGATISADGETPPLDAELAALRGLLERGRHAEALARAEALLTREPGHRDLQYVAAVALRYLGRVADALAVLGDLERRHPGFSRLYQERGHCHVALRDAESAIKAFLTAVHVNPALPASWSSLKLLYRMLGQTANSDNAAAHVATLSRLPQAVVTATALFSDGDLDPAEAIIRQFLLQHGDDVEGMRLLARIGMKRKVYDDAELLLGTVVATAPDYRAARYDYALALIERQKHAEAIEQLERLLAGEPTNRAYRITYATACVGLGRHEEGLRRYREVLEQEPRAPDLQLSVAHALKTIGRQAEAVDSYHKAIEARPGFGEAYWSLANLKTYRFTDEEIRQMRALEDDPSLSREDRYHVCFALGKALEDRGNYGDSFRYYETGNSLKKAELRFRIEPIERNARLQGQVCTREFLEARRGWGCERDDPIFVVGLPRSGSTLLEQILASHSRVEGTMELPNILRLVGELQGRETMTAAGAPRYPALLADLDAEEFRRLGARYVADTMIYRTGKPRFIDKMPNNFRHLGLIHLILPNARIIDARREAMACCFSNFKQLFANGQEFTYGIDDIARYYRSYVELMEHWDAALPGKILRIQHEEIVEDLEGNVRRMLEFCGLEFEPVCLEFYKNERSVRTASSEQVRRPIFKDGVEQWKRFEPWLEPLRAALGPLAGPSP